MKKVKVERAAKEGAGPGEREESKVSVVETRGEVGVAGARRRRRRRRCPRVVVLFSGCRGSEARWERGRVGGHLLLNVIMELASKALLSCRRIYIGNGQSFKLWGFKGHGRERNTKTRRQKQREISLLH